MLLNKKQVVIAWVMLILVALSAVFVIFVIPDNAFLSVKTFLYLYCFIFIIGFLLVYNLREKKK